MITYNRQKFFDAVRDNPFPGVLNQSQVDGMTAFLRIWEATPFTDTRWLAYMLATTYHETGASMQPIEEYSKGAGAKYGVPHEDTGLVYYGRGWPQLTWHENYVHAEKEINERKLIPGVFVNDVTVDLVNHPEQMLAYEPSGAVQFYGAAEGWFRRDSKGVPETLERYFNATLEDPYNARNIINGRLDKATEIEGYYRSFYAALLDARQTVPIVGPPQLPPTKPKPPTPPPYKPNPIERAVERDPVLKAMVEDVKVRSGARYVVLII